MSQVHSVTHVPVHSPLSEVCLPYARAQARKTYWGGRCGKERPAEVGRGSRPVSSAAGTREETSSPQESRLSNLLLGIGKGEG